MARTAAQLINLACQTAKVPGFTSQAGQFLNIVLSDLAQTYDFDVIRKTYTFNFNTSTAAALANGAQPFDLPADYLRARIQEVFYQIQGVKYVLINVELFELDGMVQSAGLNSYPTFFATDMSPLADGDPPVMYVWPPPSDAYPMTVRYQPQPEDITTPESSSDVPWFPNSEYLLLKVSAMLMNLANDDRQPLFNKQAEESLLQYLKMKDDKGGRAQTVQLDRRQFGGKWASLPNSKQVGW